MCPCTEIPVRAQHSCHAQRLRLYLSPLPVPPSPSPPIPAPCSEIRALSPVVRLCDPSPYPVLLLSLGPPRPCAHSSPLPSLAIFPSPTLPLPHDWTTTTVRTRSGLRYRPKVRFSTPEREDACTSWAADAHSPVDPFVLMP